jgi:ABC-type phosphate transport system permease subunit
MFGLGGPDVIILLIIILPIGFYLLTLCRAISRCSPESRTLSPYFPLLICIPFIGFIFHFIVIFRLYETLSNEFSNRGINENLSNTKGVGIMMLVLGLIVVPIISSINNISSSDSQIILMLLLYGSIILWIYYWYKIARYSAKLK